MRPVIYRTDIDSPSGYSRAARNHVRALLEADVAVWVEQSKHDSTTFVPDAYWKAKLPVVLNPMRPQGACIKIWHETPEFYTPDPQDTNIPALAWETSRIVDYDLGGNPRHNWVKQLNRMQEVWTFAASAKKAFMDSGVTVPIHVIPHPIDLDMYKPGERRRMADEYGKELPEGVCTFLSVFQWTRRKSPMDLLLAYWTAFQGHQDVILYIKTYGSDFRDTASIANLVKRFKLDLRLRDCPKVQLLFSHIPDVEMPDLYNSCDVYVSAAMGEGFGLPQQESSACGKPNIYPESSSFIDFMTPEMGYPVITDEEPVHGMTHIPWYEGSQRWWRVRYTSLVGAFKQAYDDWKGGKLKDKGAKARERIASLHSYERVGKMMKERLEAISG